MKKNIVYIFTTLPIKPVHVRLEKNLNILQEKFNVKIYSTTYINNQKIRINYLFLNFFFINRIIEFKKHLKQADIIYIQTLYLLPLAIFAKIRKKKVIYETLDNDIHLRFYLLTLQKPFVKYFKWIIISFMRILEKILICIFVDEIIINSKALQKYFKCKSNLLFYTSPFENIGVNNNYKNTSALLYLGYVSEEKGLKEMFELSNNLRLKLFIIGNIKDKKYLKKIENNKDIIYYGMLSSNEMLDKMKILLANYFLFGISIIHSIHYSYATQEANKDIDFLSLGVPIIGNNRVPTAEKIDAGCGIYYQEIDKIKKVIKDNYKKKIMAKNSYNYYNKYYNSNLYKNKFEKIINNLKN